jgi:hypothetical protein
MALGVLAIGLMTTSSEVHAQATDGATDTSSSDPSSSDAARTSRRAPRGSISTFTIRSTEPLQAKALRDATAPVLVRVNLVADRADRDATGESNAESSREYRIEFIGAVEGTFDLAEAIERVDGRPAERLPDLRVEIFSQLPPNHGTDVFGLSAPGFSLSTSYTVTLWTLAAAWVAVPIVVVARRAMRPKPKPPEPAPRVPGVAERLFAIVDEARGRELDVSERGRLELLMLQTLRDARRDAGADLASLAAATAALRADARDGPVVRAVEAWLHAPTAGDRTRALAELDALKRSRGATPARDADAGGPS